MRQNHDMQSFVKKLSARKGTRNHSVLNLPMERQKELAKQEGLSLDEWVEHNKKLFKRMDEFEKNLKIITFKSREEAEKAGYHPTKWQEPLIPFPA